MQKSLLVSVILFIQLNWGIAQNLVYNPGFEITGTVPCGWVSLGYEFDNAATGWTDPTLSTPDVHSTLIANTCSNYSPHSVYVGTNGWQAPHTGNTFAGFYTYSVDFPNYREYIQGQLTSALVVGKSYAVSMYVSLADNSLIATNGPGVYFSTSFSSSIITYGPPPGLTPQINHTNVITDTANWVLLTDTIVATAGWQYFIIGNFYDDATVDTSNFNPSGYWPRSYYFIDDVSITELAGVTPPIAAFQTSDSILCTNDCISFTDHSLNATSWLWTFPGGNPSSSTEKNPQTVCYLTDGNYDVKLVATGSGGKDSVTISNYIKVKPAPPTPGITQSADTLFCSFNPVYTSYQWYSVNGLIPNATDSFYVATESGNYNVAVYDSSGCSISVGINIVLNVGIKAIPAEKAVSIFPNPANDQLTIYSSTVQANNDLLISIINVFGEVVREEIIHGNIQANLNIQSLASGVYFLKLTELLKNGELPEKWIGKFIKK